MEFFNQLLQCFPTKTMPKPDKAFEDAKSKCPSDQQSPEDVAVAILRTLFSAEKPGPELRQRIQALVPSPDAEIHTTNWYEAVAKRIFFGIEATLKAGTVLTGAMKIAYDHASRCTAKMIEEHPIYTAVVVTVVALAVVYLLVPWVIGALGFSEVGPVAGKLCPPLAKHLARSVNC